MKSDSMRHSASESEKAAMWGELQGQWADWQRYRRKRRVIRTATVTGICVLLAIVCFPFQRLGTHRENDAPIAGMPEPASAEPSERTHATEMRTPPRPSFAGSLVTNADISSENEGQVDISVLSDDELLELMREVGQPSFLATIGGRRMLLSDAR